MTAGDVRDRVSGRKATGLSGTKTGKAAKNGTKVKKDKRAKKAEPRRNGQPRSGDRVVTAAGVVMWRKHRKETQVAVIHRPRYDDWSLPKGKVDPGEVEPVTAAREVLEETGHRARLGRRLGTIRYPIPQGTKRVRYWAARSGGGEFVVNHEVDELAWLSVGQASERLQYRYDRKILREFARGPVDTQTVLIVRHGTAGRRSRFSGDDTQRPLDRNGRDQADALTALLLAFGASDVHAADRLRCHQTVEGLADAAGTVMVNEPMLTEEAYVQNRRAARARVIEIADSGRTPVICTQGKVIPDLVSWWCRRDGVTPDKSRNRKGSVWVMSLAEGRLIAADHVPSPLPER